MALYHLNSQYISRGKGQCVVAAAAYRSGSKLIAEFIDRDTGTIFTKVFDYRHKKDVAFSEMILPKNAPKWMKNRQDLWNHVERIEKRKDAQLAREIEVALQRELNLEQNLEVVRSFITECFTNKGIIADLNIHLDDNNPHAHILLTTRDIIGDGFGNKNREWDRISKLFEIRRAWADTVNRYFKKYGLNLKIDHRSYKNRGVDLLSTIHEGRATKIKFHAERIQQNEQIREENAKRIIERPDIIIDLVASKYTVFNKAEIATEIFNILERSQSYTGNDYFEKVLNGVLTHERLAIVTKKSIKDEVLYSTKEKQDIEESLWNSIENLQKNKNHSGSPLYKKLARNKLSAEQEKAVEHLTNAEGISVLLGRAGTGKSRLLKAVAYSYALKGYKVLGGAVSGIATDNLATSCGRGTFKTVAGWNLFLQAEENKDYLNSRSLFIIDEASMVDIEDLAKLSGRISEIGCKLILTGDSDQIQAINSPGGFKAICDRTGYYSLEKVWRQKEKWQKAATVKIANGDIRGALNDYDKNGCIKFVETREQAKNRLITAYVKDFLAGEKGNVALAFRKDTVNYLNCEIRDRLIKAGELIEVKGAKYKTHEGIINIAKGEQIVFTKNDVKLDIHNGTRAIVTNIRTVDSDRLQGKIEFEIVDKNRKIIINTAEYNNFSYGYAITIHKSQALSIKLTYLLAEININFNAFYVGASRHRERLTIFADKTSFTNLKGLIDVFDRDHKDRGLIDEYNITDAKLGYFNGVKSYIESKEELTERYCSMLSDIKEWNIFFTDHPLYAPFVEREDGVVYFVDLVQERAERASLICEDLKAHSTFLKQANINKKIVIEHTKYLAVPVSYEEVVSNIDRYRESKKAVLEKYLKILGDVSKSNILIQKHPEYTPPVEGKEKGVTYFTDLVQSRSEIASKLVSRWQDYSEILEEQNIDIKLLKEDAQYSMISQEPIRGFTLYSTYVKRSKLTATRDGLLAAYKKLQGEYQKGRVVQFDHKLPEDGRFSHLMRMNQMKAGIPYRAFEYNLKMFECTATRNIFEGEIYYWSVTSSSSKLQVKLDDLLSYKELKIEASKFEGLQHPNFSIIKDKDRYIFSRENFLSLLKLEIPKNPLNKKNFTFNNQQLHKANLCAIQKDFLTREEFLSSYFYSTIEKSYYVSGWMPLATADELATEIHEVNINLLTCKNIRLDMEKIQEAAFSIINNKHKFRKPLYMSVARYLKQDSNKFIQSSKDTLRAAGKLSILEKYASLEVLRGNRKIAMAKNIEANLDAQASQKRLLDSELKVANSEMLEARENLSIIRHKEELLEQYLAKTYLKPIDAFNEWELLKKDRGLTDALKMVEEDFTILGNACGNKFLKGYVQDRMRKRAIALGITLSGKLKNYEADILRKPLLDKKIIIRSAEVNRLKEEVNKITNKLSWIADNSRVKNIIQREASREEETIADKLVYLWEAQIPYKKTWDRFIDARNDELHEIFNSHFKNNFELWKKFIVYITESKFLMGEKSSFRISLGWAIKEQNLKKILDGKYHHTPFATYISQQRKSKNATEDKPLDLEVAKPSNIIIRDYLKFDQDIAEGQAKIAAYKEEINYCHKLISITQEKLEKIYVIQVKEILKNFEKLSNKKGLRRSIQMVNEDPSLIGKIRGGVIVGFTERVAALKVACDIGSNLKQYLDATERIPAIENQIKETKEIAINQFLKIYGFGEKINKLAINNAVFESQYKEYWLKHGTKPNQKSLQDMEDTCRKVDGYIDKHPELLDRMTSKQLADSACFEREKYKENLLKYAEESEVSIKYLTKLQLEEYLKDPEAKESAIEKAQGIFEAQIKYAVEFANELIQDKKITNGQDIVIAKVKDFVMIHDRLPESGAVFKILTEVEKLNQDKIFEEGCELGKALAKAEVMTNMMKGNSLLSDDIIKIFNLEKNDVVSVAKAVEAILNVKNDIKFTREDYNFIFNLGIEQGIAKGKSDIAVHMIKSDMLHRVSDFIGLPQNKIDEARNTVYYSERLEKVAKIANTITTSTKSLTVDLSNWQLDSTLPAGSLYRKFVLLNLGSSLTVYSLKWYFRTQSVDTFFKKIS